VLAAFLLFGLLDSVHSAFTVGSRDVAGVDRLVTVSKVSFTLSLPKSLHERIQAVPGVRAVTYANWFGGIYQDPKNFFPSEAVAPDFLSLYPEWTLPEAQRKAFRDTRTGAVVGASLARQFGWKVGDKIPLQATIFPQKNGSNDWSFDLVGIYHVTDPKLVSEENLFFFNWDYFDEARQFGNGSVGWYITKVTDPGQADQIAQRIDALSLDSDHETKTQSEQAFNVAFVSQFADIGLIVGAIMGAVFFTLILLTGNTMAQAVRERIAEIAILKTIGFSNRSVLSLVLAEGITLLLIGAAVGLILAGVVVSAMRLKYGTAVPLDPVGREIWLQGLGLAVVVGLVVGALPALRGMRLRIVDALSGR